MESGAISASGVDALAGGSGLFFAERAEPLPGAACWGGFFVAEVRPATRSEANRPKTRTAAIETAALKRAAGTKDSMDEFMVRDLW